MQTVDLCQKVDGEAKARKRFGSKFVRGDSPKPFTAGPILEEETIELFIKNNPKLTPEFTRYKIDRVNSVQIDPTRRMGRKDTRTEDTASPMVQEVEYLLNNINEYVCDFRSSKPDIKYVMGSIEDNSDRVKYIIRLLTALSELSGVRFDADQTNVEPENGVREKYLNLGNWILDTWVPENKRDYVIQKVYEDEEESSKKYGT